MVILFQMLNEADLNDFEVAIENFLKVAFMVEEETVRTLIANKCILGVF